MTDSNTAFKGTETHSHGSKLLGFSALVPGIGAALLPAVTCPACWPAYAGLLSSLGLGFIDYSPWLIPVTVVFLAIALATLALEAYKKRTYGPLLLGVIGSTVLVIGKFQFESEVALYIGVVLLIGASGWNAWPRKACRTNPQNNACNCK